MGTHGAGDEQTMWSGIAARNWVESQDLLDRVLAPIGEALLESLPPLSGARVLDVGCGTGGTTLAVARRTGAGGRCVGIDISDGMIDAARARAERDGVPARFVHADAQRHAFAPAAFDMIVSRFGVMFFDDFVEAFANLRRAAKTGGDLRFIAWRSADENPFMTTAERAAAPLLPNLPPRQPDGPGQFAFGDGARVRRILEDSGWRDVDVRAVDIDCFFPEADLVDYLTRLGPVGRVLHEVDDRTRDRVVEVVRAAFEPFVRGEEVQFSAACWLVGARTAAA